MKKILKALGLTKKSCLSEQIVQTTHHWLDACEKIEVLEQENAELKERNRSLLESCKGGNNDVQRFV